MSTLEERRAQCPVEACPPLCSPGTCTVCKYDDVPLRYVALWLCALCLDGAGGTCHVPGCALCRNHAPDLPLTDEVVYLDPPAEGGPDDA
jgi:hypothetical protein